MARRHPNPLRPHSGLNKQQLRDMRRVDELLQSLKPTEELLGDRREYRAKQASTLRVGEFVLARSVEKTDAFTSKINSIADYVAGRHLYLNPAEVPRCRYLGAKVLKDYALAQEQTIQEATSTILGQLPESSRYTLSDVTVRNVHYDGEQLLLGIDDADVTAEQTALYTIIGFTPPEIRHYGQATIRTGHLKTRPYGRISEEVSTLNDLLANSYAAGKPMRVNLLPLAPQE